MRTKPSVKDERPLPFFRGLHSALLRSGRKQIHSFARRFAAGLPALTQPRCACALPANFDDRRRLPCNSRRHIHCSAHLYRRICSSRDASAQRLLSAAYHLQEDGGFTAIDEGDYGERTGYIGGRILYSVPGKRDDRIDGEGATLSIFYFRADWSWRASSPADPWPLDRQATHGT